MRNQILVFTMVVITNLIFDSSVFAQSGGGAPWGGGGGSASRSAGGQTFGGGRSRLGRAQRQVLRQQRNEQLQAQSREFQRQQAEAVKSQRKQELILLGQKLNGPQNRRQNRRALGEAKDNYRALRKNQIPPEQLGLLQSSFRLRTDSINREQYTAMWPTALLEPEYESQVQNLDAFITSMSITDAASAQQFLDQLNQLNLALNLAAANGEIDSTRYAKSIRFVSGLANEIRSSDLLM